MEDAAGLFSRWSQENFFHYMMQHFAIDLLNEYGTEEIPETKRPVVNPRWRELDRQRRSIKSKLTHRQARFAALTLHPESDESALAKWEKHKAELVEEIDQLEHELTGIDNQLKTTPRHLEWDKLPEDQKFQRLAPSRKRLVDTVKMIAYRAETTMASIVREELARTDDARSLLRDLFRSEANLLPDLDKGVLRVQVHPMSNPRSNRAIAHLMEHLNAAEFTYPGTSLQLVYSIAGYAEAPEPNWLQIKIPQIRRSEPARTRARAEHHGPLHHRGPARPARSRRERRPGRVRECASGRRRDRVARLDGPPVPGPPRRHPRGWADPQGACDPLRSPSCRSERLASPRQVSDIVCESAASQRIPSSFRFLPTITSRGNARDILPLRPGEPRCPADSRDSWTIMVSVRRSGAGCFHRSSSSSPRGPA